MSRVEGIMVAMVTPMTADEKIDEDGLRSLVDYFCGTGIHGLFCLGTQGEFYALEPGERLRVAEIVVDEARGRVPVYVGAGDIATRSVISLAKALERIGVDGISVVTPYYVSLNQNELYYHFKKIAAAVSIPILMYNFPARTGVHLLPETVKKLSQIDNIVGIKDSSGDFENILSYINCTDDDFSVLAGRDTLIYWTLMAGGQGAVAATANIAPRLLASIYDLFKQGKYAEARAAQERVRALRDVLKLGTGPSVIKEAMNLIGHKAGPTRAPVLGLDETAKAKLKEMLSRYEHDR